MKPLGLFPLIPIFLGQFLIAQNSELKGKQSSKIIDTLLDKHIVYKSWIVNLDQKMNQGYIKTITDYNTPLNSDQLVS